MKDSRYWTLNGTYLGPFFGLSDEHIKSLKHEGTIAGVECFSSPKCPKGTIEFWAHGRREAVITGIGKPE